MLVLIMGLAFLYLPLVIVMGASLDSHTHYTGLVQDPLILSSLTASLRVSGLAASLSTLLSLFLALLIKNLNRAWSTLLFVYTLLPDIVVALSLLSVFTALGIKIGFWTLVFSYIILGMSASVFCILQNFDARIKENTALEVAARDLGASRLNTLLYIVLPGMYNTALIMFLYTMSIFLDDVRLVGLLSGSSVSTLSIVILSSMRSGPDYKINALSTVVITGIMIMAYFYRRYYQAYQ